MIILKKVRGVLLFAPFLFLAFIDPAQAQWIVPKAWTVASQEKVVLSFRPQPVLRRQNGEEVRLGHLMHIPSSNGHVANSLEKAQQGQLYFPYQERDHLGRKTGHWIRDDGRWLNQQLIALGAVLFWPDQVASLSPEIKAALLTAEDQARQEKRGIWAEKVSPFQCASAVKGERGVPVVVEGYIHTLAERGRLIFINTSDDWDQDFTIIVKGRAAREWLRETAVQEGQLFQVRGWLDRWNGPLIEVTSSDQIRFLSSDHNAVCGQ